MGPEDPRTRPCTLLAEDDHELRALMARVLEEDGHQVTECRHGLELLLHLDAYFAETASCDGEPEVFDLVISDVRLPGLTSFEVLSALQRERLPPTILITAFGNSETYEEASRLGVAAMLDKPFTLRELMEKVRELIDSQDLRSRVAGMGVNKQGESGRDI